MNRLPQELQLIVNREVGDAEWPIDDILSIEETELSAREREREREHLCHHMVSHMVWGYLQPQSLWQVIVNQNARTVDRAILHLHVP